MTRDPSPLASGGEPPGAPPYLDAPDGTGADRHRAEQVAREQEAREQEAREQEERFRLLIEHAPSLLTIFDAEGRITYNSPSVELALGWKDGELLGRSFFDFIHPDDGEAVRRMFRFAVAHPGELIPYQVRFRHRDGGWRLLEGIGKSLLHVPAVRGVIANSSDITDRAVAEEALRESEERFRLLVEGSTQVFFYVQDAQRTFRYLSPSVQPVLGYDGARLIGERLDPILVTPEDHEAAGTARERLLAGGDAPGPYVVAVRHRDNAVRYLELIESPLRTGGEVVGIQGIARDVTREHELERQLVHAALHDRLTGLPNRARFTDRLEHTAHLARRRPGHLFAVLLLDLDRFKIINDSLGHVVGDQLLVHVARRLERSVRPGDTVTRLGGDEFALLLDEISNVSDATRVADRIGHELAAPFSLGGHEAFTTASIGIALSADGWREPNDLVRNADIALYRAKARGRAHYEVFDRAMHALTVHRLQLETDMRRAAERDEFHVAYQPIVTLATGELAGFEALARWAHPVRGAVEPGEFIPVAEDMGLVAEIDRRVMFTACTQLHTWQERYPERHVMMSVNLSGRHFATPGLADEVRDILARTGVRPGDLRLEITEGVLVERGEAASATLSELRALGVYLQIDDFGTGYSSLAYLRRFPVDALKIDRTFVQHDGPDTEIVRAIVTMAHSLRLSVVAEGVETERQRSQLRALTCDYGQGFLFAEPLAGADAEALLAMGRCW